jgi:hypothetical protein
VADLASDSFEHRAGSVVIWAWLADSSTGVRRCLA